MQDHEVISILQNQLNYSPRSISDIKLFINELLRANKKHNFISKSTENVIWHRHILDSAQLVKFIDFSKGSLSDLGSGAGFPGLIIALFNKNKHFHVKLYEKSPVKRAFLKSVSNKLSIKVQIFGNIYEEILDSDYIVSRAFKKLETIIQVSREITKKSHKLIILKGQNAHEDIKKAFKIKNYAYKLEDSITNKGSKIIIINLKK
ncbi:16S rRNA (guanine(527)-N(7))-methyltransferase RsmG [Pelagibacteraceae bacterium]|jgi:16S rRNA (guanine527-N7)-methyltransferase|nr:16S rRNA (guanine(527)-N(7))-methyltransferase RsmG [Pelagibacteraceae bacterium]MDC0952228.1 16S rRNA (guanine(527)-N(7))-methyltransferase RsmG [Pelagibacteraceae bacterium]